MTNRTSLALLALALAIAVVTPADAANREHQQLMADIRMLQEQSQQVQNLIGSLTGSLSDGLKVMNARLDEQTSATRRALADQKLVIDNLSNDVRVIREKLDDNNVRIGSLTQEVGALRQSLQQLSTRSRPPTEADAGAPTGVSTVTAGAQTPALAIGMSPQKLWDTAYSDYTSGQWDLAIQGFDMYIKSFPKSDTADNAQVNIGNAYLNDGKPDKAVEAYDRAIRAYQGGDAIPEAYFKKGLALQNLKDLDRAREAWEYAVKNFPDSDGGRISKQRLDQLKKQ
jgi:TolA-binding protein